MRPVRYGDIVKRAVARRNALASLRDEERPPVREGGRHEDESGDCSREAEREPAHGFLLR